MALDFDFAAAAGIAADFASLNDRADRYRPDDHREVADSFRPAPAQDVGGEASPRTVPNTPSTRIRGRTSAMEPPMEAHDGIDADFDAFAGADMQDALRAMGIRSDFFGFD